MARDTPPNFRRCKIIYVRYWPIMWYISAQSSIYQSVTILRGSFSKAHPEDGIKKEYFYGQMLHNKTADIFTFNNISNLNFVPSDPHELPSISKLSTPELPYLSARGVANFSSVGNPVQLPEPSQPINDTDMPISALNDSLLMSNPFSCWEPSSSPRPKSRCNNFCYIQPAPGQNSTPLSTSKGHGSDDQRNWDLLMQFGSSQQQGINAATLSKQPDKQIPACKLLECSKSFSYGGNY
jgi:hypothetical protein